MNEATSRALLYGGALAVLGGIAAWWANTDKEADVVTLLSGANAQLQMAHAMPAVDLEGVPLDSRDALIATAIDQLERVERVQPGMAVTAEFRGFAHMLHGEFRDAAACYEQARACEDCGDEQRDVLAFNQARMLAKAGDGVRALEVFAANKVALDERYGHQRVLEEAAILAELGRHDEVLSRLAELLGDEHAPPVARLQAGRLLLDAGHDGLAEVALDGARHALPIADYYYARLKLRGGDVDTCLESLTRVVDARPAEVRRLVTRDAGAWSDVRDERIQRLLDLQLASPGR